MEQINTLNLGGKSKTKSHKPKHEKIHVDPSRKNPERATKGEKTYNETVLCNKNISNFNAEEKSKDSKKRHSEMEID